MLPAHESLRLLELKPGDIVASINMPKKGQTFGALFRPAVASLFCPMFKSQNVRIHFALDMFPFEQ